MSTDETLMTGFFDAQGDDYVSSKLEAGSSKDSRHIQLKLKGFGLGNGSP